MTVIDVTLIFVYKDFPLVKAGFGFTIFFPVMLAKPDNVSNSNFKTLIYLYLYFLFYVALIS